MRRRALSHWMPAGVGLLAVAATSCHCGGTLRRVDAAVTVEPTELDFGTLRVGAVKRLALTVRNEGVVTVRLQEPFISEDVRGAFTVGTVPGSLLPGTNVTIDVTYFAPTEEGADTAFLTVASDGDPAEHRILLRGQAVAACPKGLLECAGQCVDPLSDVAHCGGCDRACVATQTCLDGRCRCQPMGCGDLGKQCGSWPDGCGGTVECGGCVAPRACAASGQCEGGNVGRLFMTNFLDSVVRVSVDQGVTWTTVGRYSNRGPSFGTMVMDPTGRLYVAESSATAGNVYRSEDNGASWSLAASVPNAPGATVIASDPRGCLYLTGSGGDVFTSADHGSSWRQVGNWGQSGFKVAMSSDASGRLFLAEAAWGGGRVFLSTDQGRTWSLQGAVAKTGNNAATIASLSGARLVGLQGGLPAHIFVSTDTGMSWSQIGSIPDSIQRMTATATDELYTVSNNSSVLRVFRSGDHGVSWTQQSAFSNGTAGGGWADIAADYPFAPLAEPCR
ncbi:MAG: choice-of-anchor D domain-containing protein [Myxococcota bacterium]